MSETRDIFSQPAIIYLITNHGHLESPPIEWTEGVPRVEYTFDLKRDCFISGYVIAHPDGVVFYRETGQIMRMTAGPFTIAANVTDQCEDPTCRHCNKPT